MVKRRSDKYYDPILSMSKLIVYFNDGNVRTFHSNLRRDSAMGMVRSGVSLIEKLLINKFKHQYKTAILVENASGKVLEKWYCGRKMDSSIS